MTIKRCLTTWLALLIVTLCVACGSKIVRGQAPIVRISELSHGGGDMSLQLNIRNLNGVPLDVQTVAFRLTIEDQLLIDYRDSSDTDTNITANGTEVREFRAPESAAARSLLNQLQNGEVKSLPYSLEGNVSSTTDGRLRFSHEGHIYPVPGRPGHFR